MFFYEDWQQINLKDFYLSTAINNYTKYSQIILNLVHGIEVPLYTRSTPEGHDVFPQRVYFTPPLLGPGGPLGP